MNGCENDLDLCNCALMVMLTDTDTLPSRLHTDATEDEGIRSLLLLLLQTLKMWILFFFSSFY